MPDPIVSLNEESLRADLGELVRRTVEDTLNGLLEEEAGDLVGAERYERTADREAYRAGHYDRSLATSSGEAPPAGRLRLPRRARSRSSRGASSPGSSETGTRAARHWGAATRRRRRR